MEGDLHKLHKHTVAQELQKQAYGIHFEPWAIVKTENPGVF